MTEAMIPANAEASALGAAAAIARVIVAGTLKWGSG